MAKLWQVSESTEVTNLVLQVMREYAPILLDAEYYKQGGASANYQEEPNSEGNYGFRDVNEDPNTSGGTRNENAVPKRVFYVQALVDTVIEDRGIDPESELAVQTKKEVKQAAKDLQRVFFEGDNANNPKEFDGMRNLVPSANVEEIATDGLQVPLGNDNTATSKQQQTIEELLKFVEDYDLTHLYMHNHMKLRLLTVAKNLNYYQRSKDELGNTIEKIGDVTVRAAKRDANGNLLLPFTETVGASNDCSSIFGARWGEKDDLTVCTSAGVKSRYLGEVGEQLKNSVNLDSVLTLEDPEALAQSKGWRLG